MPSADYARFGELTYEDFRALARDAELTPYERIGFPDSYREGFEEAIFADMRRKLPALDGERKTVVDIGPGCSDLPRMLRELCEQRGHRLVLVDSPEMLEHHEDAPDVHKLAGRFPEETGGIDQFAGRADAVIAYSVLHYVYPDHDVHAFLDAALGLLAHGGALLIGDVPNRSMRDRFFSSPAGVAFHQDFMGDDSLPAPPTGPQPGQIDDAVLLDLATRARSAGFHSWLLPQPDDLPMANRREDLLFVRP